MANKPLALRVIPPAGWQQKSHIFSPKADSPLYRLFEGTLHEANPGEVIQVAIRRVDGSVVTYERVMP